MIVIDIEPLRLPGARMWRPWLCLVHCPGKRQEKTSRKWTREAAELEARRLAGHLASGRDYTVRIKYKEAS